MVWGALGDFTFEAQSGPFEEELSWNIDYSEHARIGRKPTLQLTALGLQSLSWRINLHRQTYPELEDSLETLKTMAEQGGPQELTYGDQPDTGVWAGQWVIESFKVSTVSRAPGGRIHSMELEIKLKEWVEREGLITHENPKPPPAVRPPNQQKPKVVTESGYSKDK